MNSSFYGGDHDKAKMMGHFIESEYHLMLMPKDTKTIENFPTDFTTGAPCKSRNSLCSLNDTC